MKLQHSEMCRLMTAATAAVVIAGLMAGPSRAQSVEPSRRLTDRANAAMSSIQANRAGVMRGMQQRIVHSTPDIAYGVHQNMRFRTQAVLNGTYGSTLRLSRPISPRSTMAPNVITIDEMRKARLRAMRQAQFQQYMAQRAARAQEFGRRLEQRTDPNGPVYDPGTVGITWPGSDLLRQDFPVGVQPEP